MDTITHGIAGALIGKAVFRGEDMFAAQPMNRGRIITWSLVLGAIFPDFDVIRDFFSSDKLLIVTWHRSITHSLVMFPLWALLLAGITRAFANRRKWEAPSFAALTAIYAAGILSHVLLDLVTSFGTMIWSPLEWSRPAWDLIFIVDFTLTAIFLLPAFLGGGLKIQHDTWNRAGLAASVIYVASTVYAHHVAFSRIQKFAELHHLQVESIGALPLPPSLWHWDGLVRTARGVYELRMDLAGKPVNDGELLALEHHYYPDAPPNSYIEIATRLPEVQKVLWFSRFPVTRFHKEGDVAVVEISDIRFVQTRRDHPPSFTYRVRFGPDGSVLSQGWATR